MQKITSVADMKSAIRQLEFQQANELSLIKEQFHVIYESLKPINMIKQTIKEMLTSPDIKSSAVNAAIGFTTGLIAKKVLVGSANNHLLTKLLGIIVEMFVAKKVAGNADGIKSVGNIILQKIMNRHNNAEKVNG